MSVRESKYRKQIHLAAHFPGVNNTTVWSDTSAGSQIDFASFVHLAQTAERGLFDFLFLAEGLRLREHRGHIHDPDVVGRPDVYRRAEEFLTVARKFWDSWAPDAVVADVDGGTPAPRAIRPRPEPASDVFPAATFALGDTSKEAQDHAGHIREQQVGTPGEFAADIDHYVQSDACDGFIFVPHLTHTGSTSSSTGWCHCCRSGVPTAPNTAAAPCATTLG